MMAGGACFERRAGHAQTSTTVNIYVHAIRTGDEMAAEVLSDMLKPENLSGMHNNAAN
jgi:hypothetical protein